MIKLERFIQFVVWFTLGFLALRSVLFQFIPDTSLQTAISAISIAGCIVLFVSVWKKYFWKIKSKPVVFLGSLLGFIDYPNIGGKWKVEVESSYALVVAAPYTKKKGEATIKQEYDKISVTVKFKNEANTNDSKSYSFIAVLKQSEDECWYLIYGYTNNPQSLTLTNSHSGGQHNGFTYLDVEDDLSCMEGYYCNDENRKTRGKIKFIKN